MNNRQITTLWSSLLIEALIRQGIDFFCISPGSRSTPLTIAAARNHRAGKKLFADERSAAFFALGYARATGKPAPLICTSGTAVANYFPAVVEASMDFQPMLILSADRPFELLECGASQTIRQEHIFGNYTRWSMQLPAPSVDVPLPSLLSTVEYAVAKALDTPAGPVHLNQPFREPFDPELAELSDHAWWQIAQQWLTSKTPHTSTTRAKKQLNQETLVVVQQLLREAKQPLLIAGSMHCKDDAEAVATLANNLHLPLYADFSSGLRMKSTIRPLQLLMQSPEWRAAFKPDVVLHFGGNVIVKHLPAALRAWQPKHYIVVREEPMRFSPDHNVTHRIEASIADTANALHACRSTLWEMEKSCTQFYSIAAKELDKEVEATQPITEIAAARLISQHISSNQALFVSNSMAVRDMDMYAESLHSKGIPTAINRGASGIDGILSTAAGFAYGHQKSTTLLIGDIAFLHDFNALSLLSSLTVPMQIVVLNNNGGGIFSFLPVVSCEDVFEQYFATPQHYSIRLAAETFGLRYANPTTNGEFVTAYRNAQQSQESTIIEVNSSRSENLAHHRSLNGRLRAVAANLFYKG